jgi:hypothetical protein
MQITRDDSQSLSLEIRTGAGLKLGQIIAQPDGGRLLDQTTRPVQAPIVEANVPAAVDNPARAQAEKALQFLRRPHPSVDLAQDFGDAASSIVTVPMGPMILSCQL